MGVGRAGLCSASPACSRPRPARVAVEIWFGILKSKCLTYGHFRSVEHLREEVHAFIETWNECFAHPFTWSYTGEGLHASAVRRFARLLAIETDRMDCGFLRSQLMLMSNIAENYMGNGTSPNLIPAGAAWPAV